MRADRLGTTIVAPARTSTRSIASPGVRRTVLLLAATAVVAACTVEPRVESERSMAVAGELQPDRDTFERPTADDGGARPDDTVESDVQTAPAPSGSIAWGSCDEFGIPEVDRLGTERWECARLEVAMNPDAPDGGLPPVSLALTRHPATGDRFGSILLNPGGPGGAGLPLAWGLRSSMPPELLRGFDIVAWDPRGIGRSEPAANCPADADPSDGDFIERCVETTGPLTAFMSAPYSAFDMNEIRAALGEDRLDYLGYSYGSIIGAVYAERFPEHVGSFVLDGATDPDVGSEAGPVDGVFPTFADDGLPEALERFRELCDATDRCLAGRDTSAALDAVRDAASTLSTDDAPTGPVDLDRGLIDDLLAWSMGSAAEWELLATGLDDALDGDGSVLATMLVDAGLAAPAEGGAGGGGDPFDNFEAANFLIYCADLGRFLSVVPFCEAMPESADPLEAIAEVTLDRDVLVIGTEFDPLTPGYHAEQFAERLGDAVWIGWDGVGHTAFPGWTDCIDDVVVAQFLGNALPVSGLRCDFVEDVADDTELGDGLFGYDLVDGRGWLFDALALRLLASDDELACIVETVIPNLDDVDDEIVSELILGVTSDEAVAALDAALAAC